MTHKAWYTVLVLVGGAAIIVHFFLDPIATLPWSIPTIAAFIVGAVLAWRVPENPISWLLLVFGTSQAVTLPAFFAVSGVIDSQAVAGWLAAVGVAVNTAAVLMLPVILLRFPDGRLLSRRWRVVEWLAVAAGAVGAAAALVNGGWGGDRAQALLITPLYETTAPAGDVLSAIFFPMFIGSFVAASASMILRYRRSTGESRLQIKWLAYSAGFLLVALAAVAIESGATVATLTQWQSTVMALAFTFIPIAIGVAVLRYRLYDIDVVINRTVVLAVLAVFITVTYALIVVGLGQLIGGDSDGLLLPIAATAVVAVAFEPVRLRAQRWANRIVYGNRATPYEVLSDLTERLSVAEEGEGILVRLTALLRDGTGADRVTVWLGSIGEMTPAASAPLEALSSSQPDPQSKSVFLVKHDEEVVGALEVIKPRGSVLSTAERSLVADLAGSAGAVLGYQRLNDSLEERARELEESRGRLVGVQDQERRRLERDLHEGAEQFIVALKVKIGVSTQMAGKHDAPELEALLGGLTDEAQAALDDVQSLAKGIYPPILESDGLGAAVSALASSTPVDIHLERDGVGRYPAEVEAAVYFDVSEAVTNAVKHANPPIRIELSDRDGLLSFSVIDAGPGFDIDQSDMGSGLENMADRLDAVGGKLTVESTSGETTEISGKIPVG